MYDERVTQWAAVDGERQVIATFKDHKDAGSYAAARALMVVKLVQVRYYEAIITCAELEALREKAKGPRIDEVPPVAHASTDTPTPRPFKVGDFVRDKVTKMSGTVVAVDSTCVKVAWSSGTVGEIWWPMDNFELLTPAPAPEATAAPGEPLKAQMVPVSLLVNACKQRDEWKAKCDDTEVRLDELLDTIDDFTAKNKELTARAEKAERERDKWQSYKVENATLRAVLAKFEDGGMSGREVRAARDDERSRFERETAARILAGYNSFDDGEAWAPVGTPERLEVYQGYVSVASQQAALLADHYFPAKEQGK